VIAGRRAALGEQHRQRAGALPAAHDQALGVLIAVAVDAEDRRWNVRLFAVTNDHDPVGHALLP